MEGFKDFNSELSNFKKVHPNEIQPSDELTHNTCLLQKSCALSLSWIRRRIVPVWVQNVPDPLKLHG